MCVWHGAPVSLVAKRKDSVCVELTTWGFRFPFFFAPFSFSPVSAAVAMAALPPVSLGVGELQVVSEELLARALREQEELECAEFGDLVAVGPLLLHKARKLVLSYRRAYTAVWVVEEGWRRENGPLNAVVHFGVTPSTVLYQIRNLDTLDNLTELRLDNNSITKIEHLDHLVNLTWLGACGAVSRNDLGAIWQ